MKRKTQYTIEMDSHLSAKAWKLLSENFEITFLKRHHSLDGQDMYWHFRLDGEKSDEDKTK